MLAHPNFLSLAQDLLGQCGHYSERVRLDSLHGLTELLQANPALARLHGAAIISTAAERTLDPDGPCRAALRQFCQKALLPALGPEALQPFIPVLMGHVCSAMTHLAEPIRVDALALLSVLMDWRADLVVSGYLTQVMHHFADALGRPTRGRSLKAGSLAALLAHVTGLQNFLSKAIAALPGSKDGDARNSALNIDQPSGKHSAVPLMASRCSWPPALPLQDIRSPSDSGTGTSAQHGAAAAHTLLLLLLDCWRECSPWDLEAHADVAQVRCACAVLQCCGMILGHWGVALAGPLSSRTSAANLIIQRVAGCFPFHNPVVPVAAAVQDHMVQLNVAAAQLLVALLPAAVGGEAGPPVPNWVSRLLDWLADLMASGEALPSSEGGHAGGAAESTSADAPSSLNKGKRRKQGGDGARGVPAAVYGAALDAVAQILPHLAPHLRRQMLGAAWALWERTQVRSASRGQVLAFFAAFMADPAASLYTPLPPTGEPLVLQEEAAAWVAAMPRFLWELGTTSPGSTASALRLLLDAARFAPTAAPPGPLGAALGALQPQLAPLFAIEVPAGPGATKKGKKGGGTSAEVSAPGAPKLVIGPLAALPESMQSMAADLLFHLPGLPESTLKVVGLAALAHVETTRAPCYPLPTALKLLDAATMKAAEADPGHLWGLLLALLVGKVRYVPSSPGNASTRQGGEEPDGGCGVVGSAAGWRRHLVVVAAACRAATSIADGMTAVDALVPPLLAVAKAQSHAGGGDEAQWAALLGAVSMCVAALQAPGGGHASDMPIGAAWEALPSAVVGLIDAAWRQDGAPGDEGGRQAAALQLALRLIGVHPGFVGPLLQACMDSVNDARISVVAIVTLIIGVLKCESAQDVLLGDAAEVAAALVQAVIERAGMDDSAPRSLVLEMQTLVLQKLGQGA